VASDPPLSYEFRVRGRVGTAVREALAEQGLESSVEPVETILHGPVADQAALQGLLSRFASLGLELIEARRLPPAPSKHG
jgi:hypothetical protein